MQFPLPSQSFAGVEIKALRKLETDVKVHSLMPQPEHAYKLMKQWDLSELEVTFFSWRTFTHAFIFFILSPFKTFFLLNWLIATTWHKPKMMVKSLILLPRAIQIYQEVQQNKPDVVHLFWGHYPSMVGYMVKRWLPEITLSMFLGAYDLVQSCPLSSPVAVKADIVWTHARANIPKIRDLGVKEENIVISYRGIDLSNEPENQGAKIARRIVTAGRLIPAKGMDTVLRSFGKVLEHWADSTLVVLGEGPDQRRLEKLAEELGISHAVYFKGYIPHKTIFEEFALADVFILMSESESERLPNVVKEAMLSCCVCVVSRTPGIDELIPGSDYGVVLPTKDIDAVAKRIIKIFNDPTLFNQVRIFARNFIFKNFDASAIAKDRHDRLMELQTNKRHYE